MHQSSKDYTGWQEQGSFLRGEKVHANKAPFEIKKCPTFPSLAGKNKGVTGNTGAFEQKKRCSARVA